LADVDFENPDGSALVVDTDLLEEERDEVYIADYISIGPIAALKSGANRVRVW
jgi:hypothetical protein